MEDLKIILNLLFLKKKLQQNVNLIKLSARNMGLVYCS